MSAFEAFLTGFMGKTAEKIDERKDKASTYFDQQMERARTVGVDALRQRREATDQTISVARSLRDQANMPEEIIRGLANEGPQALLEAQKIYAEAASRGVPTDEAFWEQAYQFSTEITSSTDTTLEDFLRQTSGLYGSNLDATIEEGGDPFGAFVASGLGLNAMSRARSELESTEVAEGFSAADLLAMEGRPLTTRPLGDTGYSGPDLGYVAATVGASAPDMPSSEDIFRVMSTFDDLVESERELLFDDAAQTNPSLTRESLTVQAEEAAAIQYYENLGGGDNALAELAKYPRIFNALPESVRNPEATTESVDEALRPEIVETELPPVDTPPPADLPPVTIPDDPGPTAEQPTPLANLTELTNVNGERAYYQGIEDGKYVFRFPGGNILRVTEQQYLDAIENEEITIKAPSVSLGLPE